MRYALLTLIGVCIFIIAFIARINDEPSEFIGDSAGEPVAFDLVGHWHIFRFTTAEREAKGLSPKGRYETSWNLMRVEDFVWEGPGLRVELKPFTRDNNSQYLCVKDEDPETPEFMFINTAHFGHMQVSGSDGELYALVRREGGEDSPPLKYQDP